MAATRLIPLHLNKGKTVADCLKERLDYAHNPLKTEDGEYVSSYQCDPRTAAMEFLLAKAEYDKKTGRSRKGDVIAYQIRQSFKPGEITPEEANRIGYELAMRFTKGKHAFTVSTHTDRKHIHNHIIFNSTNLDCKRKFRNFFLSAFALQRCSDLICFEHGLSIIEPKPYDKREKRSTYPARHTRRSEIKHVIEMIFRERNPENFEEFIKELEREGYSVKCGKHIAVKGHGQKRYIRLDSLGDGYDQESLKGRFDAENESGKPYLISSLEETVQRCRIRLCIRQGSFCYNRELGGNLHKLDRSDENLSGNALLLVREALLPIKQVVVKEVSAEVHNGKIVLDITISAYGEEASMEVTV